MLANYDAKAVADVMGIAFLEDPDGRAVARSTPAEAARAPGTTAAPGSGRFVIDGDPGRVRIVESRTRGALGRSGPTASGPHRHPAVRGGAMRSPSSTLIEKAVEIGLPRLALRHVAAQIAGADKAKIASLEWVIVPKTTLERRTEQLSPLESERTERVARLFVHARRALGTEAEARAFMTTPHPLLDGRTPIDAARTDLGARRTEQILNALEYGLAL